MIDDIIQIDINDIKSIEWADDHIEYDLQLYRLGLNYGKFIVVNPWLEDSKLKDYIEEIPSTNKCVVWQYQGDWVAKLFNGYWTPEIGYEILEITKPTFMWSKNPDIDKSIQFEDNPYGYFEPEPWDSGYQLVWYMDPRVNPTDDKIWVMSCRPIGKEIKGVKDMGYVMPLIDVEYNEVLPNLDIDIDQCYPAYWELTDVCAWELDPIHTPDNRMWVVKFSPGYKKVNSWKWYGTISPEYAIEYNPDLPKMDYEIDYVIPWYDLGYEHVWMLDNKHLVNDEDEIWAIKVKVIEDVDETKFVGYVSPIQQIEYNPDLPKMDYVIDYTIPWHDLGYEHVWMLDNKHLVNGEDEIWAVKIKGLGRGSKVVGYFSPIQHIVYNPDLPKMSYQIDYVVPWHDLGYEHVWYLAGTEKIWVAKLSVVDTFIGVKEMPSVTLDLPGQLDVIFISYHELNAERNWQRVLEKAPWAQRVDGVKGIFNAHRAAAKLSTTDMFYVVDGDAWLVDDWQFDFQPNIFDRDCAYVWSSQNPVNDLTYQNGGVKLFNKSILMQQKKWDTLDMFTGIMPKIKVEDKISCITVFNVDAFSTWRSAFRECVKLYISNKMGYLNKWLESDTTRPFGTYAILGAQAAYRYARENELDHSALLKINDYNWLLNYYKNNNARR